MKRAMTPKEIFQRKKKELVTVWLIGAALAAARIAYHGWLCPDMTKWERLKAIFTTEAMADCQGKGEE